jgi:hypothetical protein
MAEEQIRLVKPAAYEVAARYLRKMRDDIRKNNAQMSSVDFGDDHAIDFDEHPDFNRPLESFHLVINQHFGRADSLVNAAVFGDRGLDLSHNFGVETVHGDCQVFYSDVVEFVAQFRARSGRWFTGKG